MIWTVNSVRRSCFPSVGESEREFRSVVLRIRGTLGSIARSILELLPKSMMADIMNDSEREGGGEKELSLV